MKDVGVLIRRPRGSIGGSIARYLCYQVVLCLPAQTFLYWRIDASEFCLYIVLEYVLLVRGEWRLRTVPV
jgi:hypothetical protein